MEGADVETSPVVDKDQTNHSTTFCAKHSDASIAGTNVGTILVGSDRCAWCLLGDCPCLFNADRRPAEKSETTAEFATGLFDNTSLLGCKFDSRDVTVGELIKEQQV